MHSGRCRISSIQSTFQVTESRCGGSQSSTLPFTSTRPSGMRRMNAPPGFGSSSIERPKKYCRVNAAPVSASHSFSGVVAM